MHIQPHSHALTTRGREEDASPAPFENRKKCPDFGKKALIGLWFKFLIQNVVLIVSKRQKDAKCFPAGSFFCSIFDEMFIEVS